jgi:uncharacterized membrane protein HdeD (DUF308 family)
MINRDGNLIWWAIFGLITAVIFSKWTGDMRSYLFITFCWLFIVTLVTQCYGKFEREPEDVAMLTTASLIGFIIGSTLLWTTTACRDLEW